MNKNDLLKALDEAAEHFLEAERNSPIGSQESPFEAFFTQHFIDTYNEKEPNKIKDGDVIFSKLDGVYYRINIIEPNVKNEEVINILCQNRKSMNKFLEDKYKKRRY